MIQSFERQSHSVPQRHSAAEKSSIHLVEAHDWMGPESRTDSVAVNFAVVDAPALMASEQRA